MVFMALFPFPFSLHAFVVAAVNHCSIATVYEATNSTISIKLAYFFIYIYIFFISEPHDGRDVESEKSAVAKRKQQQKVC